MAHRIALLAFCLLPFLASAQAPSTDTKDYQTARKRLYIGTDTARYFTAIKIVLEASNTHKHVPTAKAVYDYIQTVLPVLTAGTGIIITGTYPALTITNTGDLSTTNELQDLSLSGQTLSLTSDATTVTLPIIGVAAGTGISVSTTTGTATVTNTGDTNAADDITTSTSLGGDLTGTLPNPTVDGLQGRAVLSTAPSTGEVLKWNGSAWAPAADGGGAAGHTLKDDGTSMTARTGANFISTSTVAAALTDDAAGDETEIRLTVPTDGITATEIAANAVGASEIAADAVGSSEIAADAVGSSEIATDAVGAAEIVADAVGPSELASTAVAAGTYTNATVTFDADGRATSASSGTAPVTGTGTAGQISVWTGTNTQTGYSNFTWDNGTNRLGINVLSPAYTLDVDGPIHNIGAAFTTDFNSSGSPPAQWVLRGQSNTNKQMLIGYNTTDNYGSISIIEQGVAFRPLCLQPLAGSVGVNTTSPSQPLDVNGNTRLRAALYDGLNSAGSSGNILSSTGTATQWITAATLVAAGNALTTATSFAGDVTGVYNNLQLGTGVVGATELASTAVTAGTYGSATQVPVITFDADGRATGVTNTTITTTDGNGIYSGSGSTPSGGSTVTVTNARPLIFTSTESTGNQVRFNMTQGSGVQYNNNSGTALNRVYSTGSAFINESTTRQQTIQGATSVNLLATDGVKSGLFTVNENNYITMPSYATFPTVTGGNKTGWNSTLNRITYAVGGVEKLVANVADDIQGTYNLYGSNSNIGFDEHYAEFDANAGVIIVTVGPDMKERVPYTVRCRRNGTNVISFEADSGYYIGVDGDSTIPGDTTIAVGGGGSGIQAPYKIYTLIRVGSVVWFND